jgi:hypothetical protein
VHATAWDLGSILLSHDRLAVPSRDPAVRAADSGCFRMEVLTYRPAGPEDGAHCDTTLKKSVCKELACVSGMGEAKRVVSNIAYRVY